jgi:hypothetical protein
MSESTCINDVVWCKLAPSLIHGVGVIAIRDIAKGTKLWAGENEYEIQEVLPEIKEIILDHHSRVEFWDMLPNPNKDVWMQCYVNHSNTPNSFDGVATEDILKGAEITEDYRLGDMALGKEALAYFSFLDS